MSGNIFFHVLKVADYIKYFFLRLLLPQISFFKMKLMTIVASLSSELPKIWINVQITKNLFCTS
jgi:hypothetical protein